MRETQHDLSSNHTKLDYQALLKTSITAFAHTRNEIERLIHKTHDLNERDFSATSRYILEEAQQMVVAAETMHTLEAGLDREELEIVNKPEVKEMSQ